MNNKKLLAFAFVVLIILISIGATTQSLGIIGYYVKKIPFGDKIIHFALIGTLTYAVNLIMNFRQFNLFNINWLTGSVIVFGIMTADEFSQMFLSARSFELLDLSANYIGIAAASLFIITQKKNNKQQQQTI